MPPWIKWKLSWILRAYCCYRKPKDTGPNLAPLYAPGISWGPTFMTLALPLSAAFMALNNYGRQIEISAGCQDCPFETPLSGENQFKNIVLCLYPTEHESFICYREHVKKDGRSHVGAVLRYSGSRPLGHEEFFWALGSRTHVISPDE
jgi:hypothetical protein